VTRVRFKKQQVVGRGEPFGKLRASGQKAASRRQKAADSLQQVAKKLFFGYSFRSA
jgi:hypothetical protein